MTKQVIDIGCRKEVIAILKKHAANLRKNAKSATKAELGFLARLEKNIAGQEKTLAKFL